MQRGKKNAEIIKSRNDNNNPWDPSEKLGGLWWEGNVITITSVITSDLFEFGVEQRWSDA